MGVVLGGAIVTACAFVLMGAYMLRNGSMGLLEESRKHHQAAKLRVGARISIGLLYLGLGMAIAAAVAKVVMRKDTQLSAEWLRSNALSLLGGIFLLSYGMVAIVRPDIVIRWVESSYQGIDLVGRYPSVVYLVRGLGVCVGVMGLVALKSLR